MRIAMIGTGYVGLVSGACFSEFGLTVACVDQDAAKIARLQQGEVPIFEPGLEALVATNMAAGRLSFTTDLAAAVAGAEAVFIAVGTPSRRGDGHADLSYVHAAAEAVGRALAGYAVVVTKSTVPVGTGQEVARILRRTRPTDGFDVASNPEFLREGSAIADFLRPDRVVIGTDSERARAGRFRAAVPDNLRRSPRCRPAAGAAEPSSVGQPQVAGSSVGEPSECARKLALHDGPTARRNKPTAAPFCAAFGLRIGRMRRCG